MRSKRNHKAARLAGTAALALALCVPAAIAQNREQRDEQDIQRGKITMIESGTTVPVRTRDSIDVQAASDRVYRGIVDQDVRDEQGHIAIPRGSNVELKVRAVPGNGLVLDIQSIDVNGGRYGVWADADRVEAQRDDSVVGTIVGTVTGAQVQGRAVRVPPDSALTFRIEHSMIVGLQVPDPGVSLYARLLRHDSR